MNIKNLLKKLFRHRHIWTTTHTNRWQIPTRQKCRCGVTRRATTSIDRPPLHYVWIYSTGEQSEPHPFGEIDN